MASDITLSVDLEPGDVISVANRLQAQIERIFDTTGDRKVSIAFGQLQTSMNSVYMRARDLQERMAQFEGIRIPTEQYTQLENELSTLDQQFTQLEEHRRQLEQTGQINTAEYAALEQELDRVFNSAERVRDTMSSMETLGMSHIAGQETEEYARLTDQLNQTNNQMRLYISKAYEVANTNPNPAGWELLRKSVNGVATAASSAASSVKSLLGRLLELVKGRITSGINKLSSSLFSLGKGSNSSSNGLQKGFKSLIRYGLGVRSVFALVNKLRRALLEGFKNLAGYSSSFNNTVSNFISSLNYLKNSFAAAFAPIVETVLPILTRFIDKLAEGVNKLGEFFAALTGKQTFVRAKKVYTSYVKAVNKDTDKTQTKLEKLQRTILGFDDINILKGPNDESPLSVLADDYDPSTDPKNMFETVRIGKGINDWVKKFKEMWAKADFTELGRIVGNKIKAALEKIPWEKIKTVLRKIGKSIATFLNGVLETPGLFSTIGNTIAEGINSAFEFVNAFVQNFHWDSLGIAFKDLIIGALNGLDWDLINEACVGIGGGIGTAIENALDNPEIWTSIFVTFSNGINTFVESAQAFFDAIDWRSTGTNIGTGLNEGINAIDWLALADLVGTALIDLFNGLAGFLEEVDWQNLGHKVKDFLCGIDWGGVFEAVFETIGAALGALVGFLWGFIEDFWDSCVEMWKDLAGKSGEEVIASLLDGIGRSIADAGLWVYDHVVDPLIKGFKKGFGIDSPSKVMKENGGYIVQGLFEGITKGLVGVGSWIRVHIVEPIQNGLSKGFDIVRGIANKIKGVGSAIVGGLKGGIGDNWNTVTATASEKMNELKGAFNDASNDSHNSSFSWSSIGTNICNGISEGLSSGWEWLTTSASNLATDIYNSACNALGIASPSRLFRDKVGKMIPAGLAIGIDANTGTAVQSVSDLTNQLVSAASNVQLPPIAMGKIIPYEIGKTTQQDTNNTLNEVLEMLQYNQDAMVTRDDLLTILTDVARRYFSVVLQLDRKQLARAVNRGNDELSRRFATT